VPFVKIFLVTILLSGCSLLETGEPSEPISAIPLTTTEAEEVEASEEVDDSSFEDGTASNAGSEADPIVFTILPEESEARFTIGEVLRGQPTQAIGITNQVGAEIAIDFSNPSATQLGVVQVNARTIATDENRRNQAISRFILDTGDHEFITFAPSAITGLPEVANFGEPYSFQITGDLTIRDITKEVTFDATVTPVSEERLEGNASTTVNRGDYELTIPSVPFVAEVDEEVILEIDFVATPA
jgi:polyisoprenoid-binding protein YceI